MRHMIRTRTLIATAAIALAGVVVAPAAAFAQSPNDTTSPAPAGARFDTAKARCAGAIQRRITDTAGLRGRAVAAPNLTDAHETTTTAFLDAASSGLTTLLGGVQAATDRTTLKSLCDQVVPGYRIYLLRNPQVTLAIALDRSASRVAELTQAATKIEAQLPNAKHPERAKAKLDAMKAAIAAAQAALAGQADSLLTVTPAGYNANHAVLAPFRAANRTAEQQVRKAVVFGAQATRAIVRR
jgi:hypothetical protein